MSKKVLSIFLSLLLILSTAGSVYATTFPVVIEDDFDDDSNWILTPTTDGCVTVSDGMLKIKALYGFNTHKAEANGWTIDGDYIAEVTAEVDFGTSTDKLPSNLGFLLKKDVNGNSYYFSGVRFPQDRDPGENFGICIGQGAKENASDLAKSASKIDIANLDSFKFIVTGDTIEVQVLYKGADEYVSVITYQNDALKGGQSVFSPSVRENYPHNAGVKIDKVLIYETDCVIDELNQVTENGSVNLREVPFDAEVFMEGIEATFTVPMDSENYSNITLYEKENAENTVSLEIADSSDTSVILMPKARLKSGTEYVLDYGTQRTADGYVFDKISGVTFKTAEYPISIDATVADGQLAGIVTFSGDETDVTIIPAVFQNGVMVKVLGAIELDTYDFGFGGISLGEISGDYTVKLFGWDDKDGIKMLCKPFVIEVEGGQE